MIWCAARFIHFYDFYIAIVIQLDLSRGVVKLSAFAVLAGMVLVNAVTIYVFLNKSFLWGDGTLARFMY